MGGKVKSIIGPIFPSDRPTHCWDIMIYRLRPERMRLACFVLSTETNIAVRNSRNRCDRTKLTNGSQAKLWRVGWPNCLQVRCRAYANDCFGFLRRQRRLRELLETKRVFEPAVERRDRSFLYRKHELLERTSVFVCFAVRIQASTDEAELIRTTAKHPYDCKSVPKHVD